ncbi:hypothetical protein GCM10011297_35310 [Bacterioplanes sanyensis]|uniref:hypothetical protein n=1 Tax=Bacterioplanes sanyensis TaxID=1249553 RepID=UPI001679DE2A|nr:hypothetical protein [Bacterioplanes sanyensis]GGY59961.1 hypothetical protein GCM10011297_35310 [Bacterioplanes sanyensis]
MALNFYDPSDQFQAFIAHTASNNEATASTAQCWGGMHLAFTGTNRMREDYGNSIAGDPTGANHPMADFRGYIDNTTQALVRRALTVREDDYEALAKAIGFYNGIRTRFRNNPWPRMLKQYIYQRNSKSNHTNDAGDYVCHSCKYSIEVRNQADLFAGHLRRYVWMGGTAAADISTDDDLEIEIRAGEEWCFVYGESEWVSGATVIEEGVSGPKKYRHYREDAEDDNSLKIPCR